MVNGMGQQRSTYEAEKVVRLVVDRFLHSRTHYQATLSRLGRYYNLWREIGRAHV